MKQKVLSFIYDGERFLALHSDPHPEHGEGGWFVVTGGVDEGETNKEAVIREIIEETGLTVNKIFPLNWSSIYDWGDDVCEEYNFLSFVDIGDIILNEEHSKYEWLDLPEFVKRTKWGGDKDILTNVLKAAIDEKVYFDKPEIKDYRNLGNI
tara:strand:- start:801 stop:1256 length:456 start_codon:yes stop_codon:yes gene_type:complete